MEQHLNFIFKVDIAEQCLMYRKALSHVSFIYSASQPAIMITLINVFFISFIRKLTSYSTYNKTESQRLTKSGQLLTRQPNHHWFLLPEGGLPVNLSFFIKSSVLLSKFNIFIKSLVLLNKFIFVQVLIAKPRLYFYSFQILHLLYF